MRKADLVKSRHVEKNNSRGVWTLAIYFTQSANMKQSCHARDYKSDLTPGGPYAPSYLQHRVELRVTRAEQDNAAVKVGQCRLTKAGPRTDQSDPPPTPPGPSHASCDRRADGPSQQRPAEPSHPGPQKPAARPTSACSHQMSRPTQCPPSASAGGSTRPSHGATRTHARTGRTHARIHDAELSTRRR